jgi:hypothetical protein
MHYGENVIGLESLRWVLTAVFVGASAFHLARCARPFIFATPLGERWVSEALHLLMGVSMAVMIWPWGGRVPVPVWVAVFTASTGWFVARAMWSAGRRLVPAFFATSMAAMVWMGASMPAQASSTHPVAMEGMSMGSGRLGPAGWISGILGGYLVVAAFWWFFRGLRLGGLHGAAAPERPLSWTSLCHGLMSVGMGMALLTMA